MKYHFVICSNLSMAKKRFDKDLRILVDEGVSCNAYIHNLTIRVGDTYRRYITPNTKMLDGYLVEGAEIDSSACMHADLNKVVEVLEILRPGHLMIKETRDGL